MYTQVALLPPYTLDDAPWTPNANDSLWRQDPTAMLDLVQQTDSLTDGLTGSITLVVNTSATPAVNIIGGNPPELADELQALAPAAATYLSSDDATSSTQSR